LGHPPRPSVNNPTTATIDLCAIFTRTTSFIRAPAAQYVRTSGVSAKSFAGRQRGNPLPKRACGENSENGKSRLFRRKTGHKRSAVKRPWVPRVTHWHRL